MELSKALDAIIADEGTAELAVLCLREEHGFDLDQVKRALAEKGLSVSFSRVQYKDIARIVNLTASEGMYDIPSFDLYRSRIPVALFKAIVEDMDVMMLQYGNMVEQSTGEARSRFLSPIFNRLVAQFRFSFKNTPGSVMEGRITTKGRIEYHFKAFGTIALIFVEVKYSIVTSFEEHKDAVAQVIAECDACDWNNAGEGACVPVYAILCDGHQFEFFKFDGSTKPYKFEKGRFPDQTSIHATSIQLNDFSTQRSALPFILNLKVVCETVFDLLMVAYSSCLEVFHTKSVDESLGEPSQRSSGSWERAIAHATRASEMARDAEAKRRIGQLDDADATADGALIELGLSIDEAPTHRRSEPIMNDWDAPEIRRA